MQTTSNFAELLYPGLNRIYGNAYKDLEEQYKQIFNVMTTDRAYFDDLNVSGFGLVPTKTEGSEITYDDAYQGWKSRYTMVTYGLGFKVTRELFEDDQYGTINKLPAALKRSVHHSIEILAANILNNAFTSGTGGDGSYLCVNNHARIDGGTYSNIPSTHADLSVTSLQTANIDIKNLTDDRGLLIAARPTKLVIPRDLEWTAKVIMNSTLLPGGANNDVNTMKGMYPVITNDWLTDTNGWFLLTDVPNGLNFYWKRKPEFAKDNDFGTENALFKTTYRCDVGWTDPRGIYGTTGA